jgi:hypothetical protein
MRRLRLQMMAGGELPLLLDLYPNAAAAYSLRKLRTAYSGSAIRVRRSSDNAEQDIGFVGSNLDTTALTTFCGAGNGFVTTWYDQSGNFRNATQASATFQPQIVSSGTVITVSGIGSPKPALSFDGSNDCLTVSGSQSYFKFIHDGGLATLLSVSRVLSNGQVGFLGNNGATSSNFGFYHQSNLYAVAMVITRGFVGSFSSLVLTPTNTIGASQYLLYNEIDADNFIVADRAKLYINNGSAYSNTANNTVSSANATYDLQIGAMGNNAVPLNGNHQEVVIYNSLNTLNRAGISSNINSYYGIY